MDLFGLNLSKEENDQKKADRLQKKENKEVQLQQERKVKQEIAIRKGDWAKVQFFQKSQFFTIIPEEDSYEELQRKAISIFVLEDATALIYNIPNKYNFIDIEWGKNKILKDKSVVGRAATGALLAGPAGLLIGGLSGVGNKEVTENKATLILQDQENLRVREISFNCTFSSFQKYKKFPKKALIKDEKYLKTIESDSPIVSSYLEDIKKLKELLDIDDITQDEYERKKKQLLEM